MVSGGNTDHRHQYGLLLQHRPRTSTRAEDTNMVPSSSPAHGHPQVAAQATNIGMAPGGNTQPSPTPVTGMASLVLPLSIVHAQLCYSSFPLSIKLCPSWCHLPYVGQGRQPGWVRSAWLTSAACPNGVRQSAWLIGNTKS